MLLIPPWKIARFSNRVAISVDRGYHFIWEKKPRTFTVDYERLAHEVGVILVFFLLVGAASQRLANGRITASEKALDSGQRSSGADILAWLSYGLMALGAFATARGFFVDNLPRDPSIDALLSAPNPVNVTGAIGYLIGVNIINVASGLAAAFANAKGADEAKGAMLGAVTLVLVTCLKELTK